MPGEDVTRWGQPPPARPHPRRLGAAPAGWPAAVRAESVASEPDFGPADVGARGPSRRLRFGRCGLQEPRAGAQRPASSPAAGGLSGQYSQQPAARELSGRNCRRPESYLAHFAGSRRAIWPTSPASGGLPAVFAGSPVGDSADPDPGPQAMASRPSQRVMSSGAEDLTGPVLARQSAGGRRAGGLSRARRRAALAGRTCQGAAAVFAAVAPPAGQSGPPAASRDACSTTALATQGLELWAPFETANRSQSAAAFRPGARPGRKAVRQPPPPPSRPSEHPRRRAAGCCRAGA